ncbi:hypothetical protein [Micavibrio aeruginosavorus]|uniref:hypothetical protein n=1 Tax=Micavibrio aeruginosavorus TaxID=349221 RepID=UPI003F4AF259
MYGFKKASYKDLHAAAAEASQRIYSAGISIWNGKICPGGNNVMANAAAEAFDDADLHTLDRSASPLDQTLSQMIRLRQDFMRASSDDILVEIYSLAQTAKALGWKTLSEPYSRNGPRPV